jgi:competence protein ComEA
MRSPDASRSPRQRLDHILSGHPPDPDPPPDDEVDAWVVEDDDPPPRRTPPARPRRTVSRGAAFVAALIAVVALVVAVPRVLSGGSGAQPLPPRPQPSVLASAATGGARLLSVSMPPTPSSGSEVLVHVVGQVRHPGLVRLVSGARVADALRKAGGTTRRADLSAVNLARLVADGEQVFVPAPGQSPPPAAGQGPGAAPSAGSGSPVDLNTATESELDALPGVGPVIAGRIVAWRQQHGRFASVDELTEVSGIGDATLERLRPLVRT